MLHWTRAPEKDRLNRAKHGLALAAAIAALNDPLALSKPDPHPDGDRWNTLAMAAGIVLLFVGHTEPREGPGEGETGRIISVRKATRHERTAYEEGIF